MTDTKDRAESFVNYLRSLVSKDREDRGALADLRSGLAMDPGQAPRMYRHVVPYLGDRALPDDRWFYIVGAMFGANPRQVSAQTIGKCFKLLSESGSDSIEARFVAMLAAHPDDLHFHLYHATGLLKSKEIGLDYYGLLRDLLSWNHPDRIVQNKWARDYYRTNNKHEHGEDNGK